MLHREPAGDRALILRAYDRPASGGVASVLKRLAGLAGWRLREDCGKHRSPAPEAKPEPPTADGSVNQVMPQIKVKGTDLTARVDAKFLDEIPKSVWANRDRTRMKPMCRYEGKTMTLLRAVGLMSGLSPNFYILPKNGDDFDCRARNAEEYTELPSDRLPVYRNSKSGVKGIRLTPDGTYRVVLQVNGKTRQFGQSKDLEVAKDILAKARTGLQN